MSAILRLSGYLKDSFSLSFQNMKGLGFERGKLTQPQLLVASGSSQPNLEGLLALHGVEVLRQQDRPHLFRPLGKVLGKFARSSWSIVQSHEIEKLSPLYKHSASCALGGERPRSRSCGNWRGIPICTRQQSLACIHPFVRSDSKP